MPTPSRAGAVRWKLMTPSSGVAAGAVAIVQLDGNLDRAWDLLGIRPVAVGEVSLRSLCGVDEGLVARWTPACAQLMPHGGPAVLAALADALTRAGIAHDPEPAPDPVRDYPEASDEIEARTLAALARAASPLAVDLLLDQPRRWRANPDGWDAAHSAILNRLVEPPLVVALGPANIGKSTLLNTLAGRGVAIVADEPGTTRDHVGAMIDMNGLVVRYADTPGIRETPDAAEREAQDLALALARRADLVLCCGDRDAPPPRVPGPCVRLAMRSDRGLPAWPWDAAVCGLTGEGVSRLVGLIRERLVPSEVLAAQRPWKFWP